MSAASASLALAGVVVGAVGVGIGIGFARATLDPVDHRRWRVLAWLVVALLYSAGGAAVFVRVAERLAAPRAAPYPGVR